MCIGASYEEESHVPKGIIVQRGKLAALHNSIKNSVASVRKRTIPTERPSLVSEVSANFLRIEDATWLA
jgi:hypothetical protein